MLIPPNPLSWNEDPAAAGGGAFATVYLHLMTGSWRLALGSYHGWRAVPALLPGQQNWVALCL